MQYGTVPVPVLALVLVSFMAANVTAGRHASAAVACLLRTSPGLRVTYPSDAEAHFDAVHIKLAPWLQSVPGFRRHGAAGYDGPWIENIWISHFGALARRARARSRPLRSIFGPYIPLFVPFTDHWVRGGYNYPAGLVPDLIAALRPDVAYVTVSQNDEGLTGKDELPMARIPNVLVFSAGGYGHVPVPLLKQLEPPYPAAPVASRPLLVSYVGSLESAPHGLRARMRDVLVEAAAAGGLAYEVSHGLSARWSSLTRWLPPVVERVASGLAGVRPWRGVMADSRLSLCPRGYGRSSYHLAESLQMGRVPIHVFSDTPWLPYEQLFRERLGFASNLRGLAGLLRDLANASSDELERRERTAANMSRSHFTLHGVMDQIGRFLRDPRRSDLQCQRLPRSVRDAG